MVEIVEWFRALVEQMVLRLGYPGIALTLLAELVFPPTPSETIMLFSGFLVGDGALDFWGVLLASCAGVLVGGLILYGIGLRIEPAVIRTIFERYGRFLFLTAGDYDRAQALFQRYSVWIVLTSRVLPVVRPLVPLVAGVERMPLPKFLITFTIGTVVYNAFYIWLGVIVGENWQTVLKYLDEFNNLTWALTGVGIALFIYLRVVKPRLNIKKADTAAE